MNGWNNFNYQPFQPGTQGGLIRVTGMEGAKAYQMMPNQVAALFDANEDIFYIKSTDGAGFPSYRAFSFTEISVAGQENAYVTRNEFNQFAQQIKELVENGKQFISEWKQNAAGASDGGSGEKLP